MHHFLLQYALLACFVTLCFTDIFVPKNTFRLYRQEQKSSQRNHIKFRMKTTHATGLIMIAMGANGKDYISVELYRGKIRVAADFGRGTENSLRPISGQYDMYLGKDLADNHWHTVEVIRNIRETIIFIDRGRGKMEKKMFMKSPPTLNDLSISQVSFGGYYTFAPSVLSTDKVLSRKGIQACFSEAWFAQDWPADEDNKPKINFVDPASSNNRESNIESRFRDIGTEPIQGSCPEDDPPFKPMFFPSSAVHIALKENYTINSLKIETKFRTVVAEQVVANYSTIGSGESIQFRIDRKGRIELAIDIPARIRGGRNVQLLQTTRENYHDGEWHTASFQIDNKLTSENKYLGEFKVDGITRLFLLSSEFKFNGYINIGFGFTGCLMDTKINDEPVNRTLRDPKIADQYFSLMDVGVIYGECSLKDYCNPNPCMNGGKCNQTEDNIMCDCDGTLYEGSTCHRPQFNYTCAGVFKGGERRSDVYYIDFDGMGPMAPVQALCDLGKNVETTTTQINNTQFDDVDVSTPVGTNNVDINYQANIIQMRELILNSAFCEQYVKYTCRGTPMFRSPEGPPQVGWMGGDDIVHYYWGGAKGRRGYCACGLTQECTNIAQYCNCDSLDPFRPTWDEGNFTIKEHLPVRQVQFKKVLKNSVESFLRVGHLRCSGFGSRDIAATFRKPYSFLSVDHPDQPFDNIFAGELAFDFKTSVAYHYMVLAHAHGPFSGDYIKIMIWSTTLIRVHLNFGFGDIKQDVDISSTGRTLNDNQWHEFSAMFNLKELNVTLDGIRMIQGLPLQDDPVQFNVDDKPVYIGGSYHDPYGFVGCIRSLYVNGRIHNIRQIAEGQEDFGVYPGCGSACKAVSRPCNYGDCIDEYDSFKCNCTTSPNDGKYCQNETYPKKFTAGQSISYDLQKGNVSHPVAEAILVVGFKTDQPDAALGYIEGSQKRHFTMCLVGGYLTLFWSQKAKIPRGNIGTILDTETRAMQITSRRLDNNKPYIAKLRFSTEEIFLSIPTLGLKIGENVTERFIDERNKNLGTEKDVFNEIIRVTVGVLPQANDMQIDTKSLTLPPTFTGCMSGAKFIYQPRATLKDRFPKSIPIDFFKMISEDSKNAALSASSFPTDNGAPCGSLYPTPGPLPTVGPPRQFFTKSPGLDVSVRIEEVNMLNRLFIFLVVFIICVVMLLFLFLVYHYVNRSQTAYNRLRETEKPKQQPSSSYRPPQSSSQQPYYPSSQASAPQATFQQPPPMQSQREDEQNFFL